MRPKPPVEELRDGVWSLPVVIPGNPLGYTLVYVFRTGEGLLLVDTGWEAEESWADLTGGLSAVGCDVADVHGCLVTHAHPDHHGLSARVAEASGAWIGMHPADAQVVEWRLTSAADAWLTEMAGILIQAGASEADIADLPEPTTDIRPPEPARPTRLLGDGDVVDVAGVRLRAVWTPGHTPGHLCFVDEADGYLLSGDHVLPHITPHIGLYSHDRDHTQDPLGDFLDSLAKVGRIPGIREVLPAHLRRFSDLHGRLDVLIAHHHERLDAIDRVLADDGPTSLWDIAAGMPWNRPWEEIPTMMKRAALAEATAHVRYLERRGRIERVHGPAETVGPYTATPVRYRRVHRDEPKGTRAAG